MALREGRYLFDRRIADRGNDGSMFGLRAHGRDRYSTSRSADQGSSGIDPDPRDLKIKRLRKRVQNLEIQQEITRLRRRIQDLELQREMRKAEVESSVIVWDGGGDEEHHSFGHHPPWFCEPIDPYYSGDEPSFDEDGAVFPEEEYLFVKQVLCRDIGAGMVSDDDDDDDGGSKSDLVEDENDFLPMSNYSMSTPTIQSCSLVDLAEELDYANKETEEVEEQEQVCKQFVIEAGGGHVVVNSNSLIACCRAQTESIVTPSFRPEAGLNVDPTIAGFQLAGDILIIQKYKLSKNMGIIIGNNNQLSPKKRDDRQNLYLEILNGKIKLNNATQACVKPLESIYRLCVQEINVKITTSSIHTTSLKLVQYNSGDATKTLIRQTMKRIEEHGTLRNFLKKMPDLSATIHMFKSRGKGKGSEAPFDPGGMCPEPGTTTHEVKLEQVQLTVNTKWFSGPFDQGDTSQECSKAARELCSRGIVINEERVDVPFDPGGFLLKGKLEDEFFLRRGG